MQADHRRHPDGADNEATETRHDTKNLTSERAAVVLTRLPLLAGPTDGERFSGREREWQRQMNVC